jgi:hypothetical protein
LVLTGVRITAIGRFIAIRAAGRIGRLPEAVLVGFARAAAGPIIVQATDGPEIFAQVRVGREAVPAGRAVAAITASPDDQVVAITMAARGPAAVGTTVIPVDPAVAAQAAVITAVAAGPVVVAITVAAADPVVAVGNTAVAAVSPAIVAIAAPEAVNVAALQEAISKR